MGRKESNVAEDTDTLYSRLWRTKIINADEPRLREAYSIPSSVTLRFDTRNKGAVARGNEHEICVYEDMFEAGFRFPFPKVVRETLHYLHICSPSTGSECLANLLYVKSKYLIKIIGV